MGGGASVLESTPTSNPPQQQQQTSSRREASVSVNPSGDSVSLGNSVGNNRRDPREEGFIIGNVDIAQFAELRMSLAHESPSLSDLNPTLDKIRIERARDPRVEGFIIGSS